MAAGVPAQMLRHQDHSRKDAAAAAQRHAQLAKQAESNRHMTLAQARRSHQTQAQMEDWAASKVQAAYRGRVERRNYRMRRAHVSNQQLWSGQSGMTRQAIALEEAAKRKGPTVVQDFDTGTYLDDMAFKTSHMGRTIPGYTGHMPAHQEHVGQTWGQENGTSLDTYHDFLSRPMAKYDEPSLDEERARMFAESSLREQARGGRPFVAAWRIADHEGEERQKATRQLGSHTRAPFGVNPIDQSYGRVHYQTMSQTGPGSFFVRQQAERHQTMLNQGLASVMAAAREQHGGGSAVPDVERRASSSLASQIANRRLSQVRRHSVAN